MNLKRQAKVVLSRLQGMLTRAPVFECPICSYRGPFSLLVQGSERRRDARCPNCRGLERHRLQQLVIDSYGPDLPANAAMLHFAPEPIFRHRFQQQFPTYICADIAMADVDLHLDIRSLPFAEASFDVVYASHVLEHIDDDTRAMRELHRVLKPGGFAFLPVPIVGVVTQEYDAPRQEEHFHVRAPGLDYFQRMREIFTDVNLHQSDQYDPRHQLFSRVVRGDSVEDVMDYVPVCRKSANAERTNRHGH